MSGKRDSDPRPRPWQGRALPTELFPQKDQKRLVKRRRLELPRNNFHYPLKVARLPIPPPGQYNRKIFPSVIYSECASGKRDSDPRPRPWQGRALPTELFPLIPFSEEHFSKCGAKIRLFLKLTKFFGLFFQKKSFFSSIHTI